jgi:hypothetical protein
MFGYITVDREELKIKDFNRYRAYYCGICQDLKESSGQLSRMTLTYDMTFLAILLTGLYEGRDRHELHACLAHPGQKHPCLRNRYTAYAADMNVLLVYHNLMDDWEDERKRSSYAAARLLRKAYLKTAARYPRQVKAIRRYLKDLHRAEEQRSEDIDLASGLTGRFMAEIFMMEEDVWRDELRRLGFFLGKFIYLMDAWEDVPKDRESGSYNPFLPMAGREDFEETAAKILTMMAADAARAFEKLPILENVDILRNILYSGIWTKYKILKREKDCKHEEKK